VTDKADGPAVDERGATVMGEHPPNEAPIVAQIEYLQEKMSGTTSDPAFANGAAWRAFYRAGWETYQTTDGSEQERVSAATVEALYTFLREFPDLVSAAYTLAGRRAKEET
jgi:hypothetical protein